MPEALTVPEVVLKYEAAGVGPVALDYVPEAVLRVQLESATDSLEKTFAGLMLQCAAGDAIVPRPAVQLLPFSRTTVSDFVAEQAGSSKA